MFEKEICYSLGVDVFVTRDENYPLQKAVVDHDQQGVTTVRGREASDEINRKLLEGTGAGGGEWGEGRRRWVGVDLHLLAKGTPSNKATDERRHPQPPIVMRQQGISTEETTVARSQRSMNGRDKVRAYRGGYVETVFKIESRIIEMLV